MSLDKHELIPHRLVPVEPTRDELAHRPPLTRLNELAMDLELTVPAGLLDGLLLKGSAPRSSLPMPDLRSLLLRDSTPGAVRDRVWRHVGELARAQREDWNLFALGLGYPGLIMRAVKLSAGKAFPQIEQVHFRLATEFLFALHRLDLCTPNVISRLIGATYDQASGRKTRQLSVIDLDTLQEKHQPAEIRGDPWDVLNELVDHHPHPQTGLTRTHAVLIARTYLAGEQLRTVAADLGMSPANASKIRPRAETLIAQRLGRPDLARRPHRAREQVGGTADPRLDGDNE